MSSSEFRVRSSEFGVCVCQWMSFIVTQAYLALVYRVGPLIHLT
jgi:hypothetical protein